MNSKVVVGIVAVLVAVCGVLIYINQFKAGQAKVDQGATSAVFSENQSQVRAGESTGNAVTTIARPTMALGALKITTGSIGSVFKAPGAPITSVVQPAHLITQKVPSIFSTGIPVAPKIYQTVRVTTPIRSAGGGSSLTVAKLSELKATNEEADAGAGLQAEQKTEVLDSNNQAVPVADTLAKAVSKTKVDYVAPTDEAVADSTQETVPTEEPKTT